MADAPESLNLAGALTGMDNPPADDVPKTGAATAPAGDAKIETPVIPEPEIKELAPEEPEPEPEKKKDEDEPTDDIEGAMRRGADDTKAKETAAAEQKKKDDEAAAAAEKAKATAPATERDADLNTKVGDHTHPKTRKIITDFQSKAKAARDERDAEKAARAAEKQAWEKERAELAEKAKGTTLPKETEEELKTLRERVRELDITQDPQIVAKYDKPIQSNNDAIVAVLKSQGYGIKQDAEGKSIENPKAIADLVRAGLTYDNLQPLIDKLKTAGLHGDARKIEKAIDRNEDLTEQRGREIETWKKDHGLRTQQREQLTKQQSEEQLKAFAQQTDVQLKNDLEALAKDFSAIKEPPQPLATDTPAVKAAKEKAIADYQAGAAKIAEAVKAFNPDGVAPEKRAEVVGRINSAAIQSVVLKQHVLPKIKAEMAALEKLNKELTAELEQLRSAGKLSRLQSNAPGDTPTNGSQAADLESALRSAFPA